MKHLKTFENYDDYFQRDLHASDIIDEEERLRMIDVIIDYVEAQGNPAIDLDEARFDLMNMPNGQLLNIYNQINSGDIAYESLEFMNENAESDAEFFQSLIGKKITCKKEYRWRKNSLTCKFAFVDDIMKVSDIDITIHPKDAYYIKKCDYKDLKKALADGAKIESFRIDVKNLTKKKEDDTWYKSTYVPAIKSKKQFLTYFEIEK